MILQALVEYYEKLGEKMSMPLPGYSDTGISYSLNINEAGELLGILPEKVEVQRGKKVVEVPKKMRVPEQVKRSGQTPPSYYLSDNGTFILGIPKKSKKKDDMGREQEQIKLNQKALSYFERCKMCHLEKLSGIQSIPAVAVRNFFEKWNPQTASSNPHLIPILGELPAANLVFRIDGGIYAQDDSDIDAAWRTSRGEEVDEEQIVQRCLVTGENEPIARIHPNIKGVRGAQSMGATLVGFNAEAFESYGKTQSYNAPVGEYAAFAYTTGLNYLISNPKTHMIIGDTTVVYWSETAEEQYADIFSDCMEMQEDDGKQLDDMMKMLLKGKLPDLEGINFNSRFFILGVSPNAARLSVRFFMQNTFGFFLKNIAEHHDRLSIVTPSFVQNSRMSTWRLLNETVNRNSRDKMPSPQLAGTLARAILMNTQYPMALYNAVEIRVKAEQGDQKISWGRAAIIKAFFLKRYETIENEIKECLTVSLNEETNNKAYVLGRLFSVLEDIQEKANPGINATIRDRYFNSACATPAVVFPTLVKLSTNHLKKIGGKSRGAEINFNKAIQALINKLSYDGVAYPTRLNLEEQGAFQLGYYHQTQKRYEKQKKEEKSNG
ncbi:MULTISPECIES: type I-C CRISPR-associated protein Cas8c/Csd1 [Eubacterium]|uniref:CRISPR-associated protein, Csd1 family n=1 Tax=Eubacterium barkeri TaxID=1528 RepID=A0A1H3JYI2_EUBBA|nr:type I-C CRISPR-associated protein Cas8c/Csd1 [Eubacterium barkeri]SDY44314.1 CRISPR-associated protein, Csd1 family [Eubacterium barkeri]